MKQNHWKRYQNFRPNKVCNDVSNRHRTPCCYCGSNNVSFVIPIFADMYKSSGSDLPGLTQFLVDASAWLQIGKMW